MKENNNQLELDNTNPFDKIGFEEKDVKEVEQQVTNHISSKNTPNVDDNNLSGEINYNKDTVLHLEKRRKKIVLLRIIIMFPFFIVAIFWVYYTCVIGYNKDDNLAMLIIVTLIAIYIILLIGWFISNLFLKNKITKLNLDYKREIVLNVFNSVFQNVFYQPNDGIKETTIANTCVFPASDNFKSNDYIKAKYKNIGFEFSDVFMEEENERIITDEKTGITKTEKYYITLFRGQWLILDFNRPFKKSVRIIENGLRNAMRKNFNIPMKKVEFEDEQFNRIFSVYTLDDYEAFYIVTPTMINNIMKLKSKIKNQILFCFIGNKLHIGISNSSDLFELNMLRKIDFDIVSEEILNEIKLITNFVDLLNMDDDLFKKNNN